MKMKADSTGKVAIYDEAGVGDAPFTDPMGNLSRVRFHSDLLMPAVLSTATYTVTLPSMGVDTFRDAVQTLSAHGLSGTPMVMGRIQNGSGWIPLNGSVMLPVYALDGSTTYRLFGIYAAAPYFQGGSGWRSITLGADATNIVLHEQSVAMATNAAGVTAHPALTLTIEVTTFDLNCDASNPTVGTDAVAVHMGADIVKFQRGRWRSDRKYIRTPAPSPTHYMPLGKSIEVGRPAPTKTDITFGCGHVGGVRMRWSSEANDVAFTASQQGVRI